MQDSLSSDSILDRTVSFPEQLQPVRHKSCPASFVSSLSTPFESLAPLNRQHSWPVLPMDQIKATPPLPAAAGRISLSPSTTQRIAFGFCACLCSTSLAALHCCHSLEIVPVAATPSTTVKQAADCAQQAEPQVLSGFVEGLEDLIESLSLQAHASDIRDWCDSVGAAFLEEVAEEALTVCDAALLDEHERQALLAWAAEVTEAAAAANVPIASLGATSRSQAGDIAKHDDYEDRPGCRVRWAPDLVSVVEFCPDENEHNTFTLVIVPGADHDNDQDGDEYDANDGYASSQEIRARSKWFDKDLDDDDETETDIDDEEAMWEDSDEEDTDAESTGTMDLITAEWPHADLEEDSQTVAPQANHLLFTRLHALQRGGHHQGQQSSKMGCGEVRASSAQRVPRSSGLGKARSRTFPLCSETLREAIRW